MEAFSGKWFTIYYAALGVVTLVVGLYFLVRPNRFSNYLQIHAESERPPYGIRMALRYFFLFTIPCLILSFIPFSWIELLFSVWSLFIVYLLGIQLVRWKQVRKIFLHKSVKTTNLVVKAGVIMLAVSIVMFMLSYLAINRSNLL